MGRAFAAGRHQSLPCEPCGSPRGIIYDRNHQILAANKPSFDVAIVPAALPRRPGQVYGASQADRHPPSEISDTIKKRKGDDFTPVAVKRTSSGRSSCGWRSST